jgi:transposase
MTTNAHSTSGLYLAIECGNKDWKLAFGDGQQRREVRMAARDQADLCRQIQRTRERFGLAAEIPVFSCYEAGRDGFWIDRMLRQLGVRNVVVDPASIEVKRRGKRVKTDRLDARKLLEMLIRYWVYGETKTWSVVRVPDEDQEAARRPHREWERLTKERGSHRSRIRSLLVLYGLNPKRLPEQPGQVRDWQGAPLPAEIVQELTRELARLVLVEEQRKSLQKQRQQQMQAGAVASARRAVKLAKITGVGAQTGWELMHEFFWRSFRNRREVGAASGLVGCPYNSGDDVREQGISKAGNARIRTLMVELAWRWLRFQPESALSQWYERRFGGGSGRMRRIGIVALARKLLVALWKYLEHDEVPAAARLSA